MLEIWIALVRSSWMLDDGTDSQRIVVELIGSPPDELEESGWLGEALRWATRGIGTLSEQSSRSAFAASRPPWFWVCPWRTEDENAVLVAFYLADAGNDFCPQLGDVLTLDVPYYSDFKSWLPRLTQIRPEDV